MNTYISFLAMTKHLAIMNFNKHLKDNINDWNLRTYELRASLRDSVRLRDCLNWDTCEGRLNSTPCYRRLVIQQLASRGGRGWCTMIKALHDYRAAVYYPREIFAGRSSSSFAVRTAISVWKQFGFPCGAAQNAGPFSFSKFIQIL